LPESHLLHGKLTKPITGLNQVCAGTEGRFENRSERSGCGVAEFSKRPLSARPSGFASLAICLAGFRVPAGKPASQSAGQHHLDAKATNNFRLCRWKVITPNKANVDTHFYSQQVSFHFV
jgi:hypothetical protein